MAGVVFDTSIYIAGVRAGQTSIFTLRQAQSAEERPSPLWLSAVVLEELYVGTKDARQRKALLKLEKEFEQIGRLLVPTQKDWVLTGQALAQIGVKYGYELVGRARLTNDALIALSATRNGLCVWTKKPKDFQRLAEFHLVRWEAR